MKKKVSKRRGSAKLSASLICSPVEMDGLPLSCQPSFAFEVARFGPAELKKALADFEMLTSLLRKHPKEMVAAVNHVLVGEIDAAKKVAIKIGLSEEEFQSNGGGLIWAIALGLCAGGIFWFAATTPG